MNFLFVLFILLFTFFAALGSYFYKMSERVKSVFGNYYIYLGVFSYVFSNVVFILLLRDNKLAVVFAFTGLNYVWSLLIARYALREEITFAKALAVLLIIVGVVVINF